MGERLALGPGWRAGMLIGSLGAFTAFSTFALEAVELAGGRLAVRAAARTAASVGACVLAAWVGAVLARQIGA